MCMQCSEIVLLSTGALKPTMKDFNRYVKNQYAVFWNNIAFELDLEYTTIDDIKNKFIDCETCLYEVFKAWLKSSGNTTWKVLEIAIINAKRLKDGLDPIDDLDGKKV